MTWRAAFGRSARRVSAAAARAAVLAAVGIVAPSLAAAQADPRLEALRRTEALALFDLACLASAPDFETAPEVFRAAGLALLPPNAPEALPGEAYLRAEDGLSASRAERGALTSCLVVFEGQETAELVAAVGGLLAGVYGEAATLGSGAGLDVWRVEGVAAARGRPVPPRDLFVIVTPPDRNSASRLGLLAQTKGGG